MATVRRVPPGRAGQLWLRHRLAVARRGADLLDQKLRILHEESQRLELLTQRTGAAWADAVAEAETWLLRAVTLTGERGVRLASRPPRTEVEVTWTRRMGARYPAEAALDLPPVPPGAPPADGVALLLARRAYEQAAAAAAQHAVALTAAQILAAEEASARRRLRALSTHWIPRLSAALAQGLLGLEELERSEALRLRWVRTATRPLTGDHSAGRWRT